MKKNVVYSIAALLYFVLVTVVYKIFAWMWDIQHDPSIEIMVVILAIIVVSVAYVLYFDEEK